MDNDRRSSRRAIAGIVVCGLVLALTGAAILLVRYYPVRHVEIIRKYSKQYELEPALVFAVINAESGFRDNAESSVGARGLMQIMEDTAYWIAPKAGLPDFSYELIYDPEINIRLGCFYIDMYIERFGSVETALCAYNAGGGRVESWLSNPEYSSDGKTLDAIPFAETRKYVERVQSNIKVYERLLRFYGF